MIRGVIVHMTGEQPFIADIQALPTPADTALVCTNIRLAGGKKPTYIDYSDSTFLVPLIHVRFVEIPAAASDASASPQLPAGERAPAPIDDDLEVDEEFLRKIREA